MTIPYFVQFMMGSEQIKTIPCDVYGIPKGSINQLAKLFGSINPSLYQLANEYKHDGQSIAIARRVFDIVYKIVQGNLSNYDYIVSRDDIEAMENIEVTCLMCRKTIDMIKVHKIEHLPWLLNIPQGIYRFLEIIYPWEFPQKLQFKTINSGEQMTNTFNQIIYDDKREFYKGKFYQEKWKLR